MEPKTLLQLKPELLVKAIIHRRQHLMDQLPKIIKDAKEDIKNTERALQRLGEGNKLREEFNSAIGKLNRAENVFKNSEEIISYWESKLEFGFEELLEDSQRVANGGTSSWALRKKSTKNIDGEEE